MPDIRALLDSLGLSDQGGDYYANLEPRATEMSGDYQGAAPVPDALSGAERIGMGLFDNPVDVPAGSGFLPHFLAGIAHGYGAGTARALEKRRTLNQQLQERAAKINEHNIKLSDEARRDAAAIRLKGAPSGATRVRKTLDEIKDEARARAAGTREGAPPIPRTPRAGPAVSSKAFPEITALVQDLKGKAAGLKNRGRLAESDGLYQQASDINIVHARIRQATTMPELLNVDIPDSLGTEAINAFTVALQKKKRQIEGK